MRHKTRIKIPAQSCHPAERINNTIGIKASGVRITGLVVYFRSTVQANLMRVLRT